MCCVAGLLAFGDALPLHGSDPQTHTYTMSLVTISNVQLLNNPGRFTDTIEFEITFESLADLEQVDTIDTDLQWRVTYVSSANASNKDQVLDDIAVGPVRKGVSQFVYQVPPPDPEKIPSEELVGVTVMMLSVLYRDQEFARIGYFVNNDYEDAELKDDPPQPPLIDKIARNVLEKPRVCFWAIRWDDEDGKKEYELPAEVAEQAMREEEEGADLIDEEEDEDEDEDEEGMDDGAQSDGGEGEGGDADEGEGGSTSMDVE